MKVSVLLATFNGEKYLKEQIDSLLQQTFQDFAIYISDDNSSDKTVEIINDYVVNYPNKVFFLAKTRRSGSAKGNFLYLLEQVDSDVYLFCDQDDVWTANHIEVLVNKYNLLSLEEKTLPILIHSDLRVVDEDLNILSESFFSYAQLNKSFKRKHSYLIENNVTGCVTLINHELKLYVFKDREYLRENINNIPMHDHFFAYIAHRFGQIIFVNEKLELYRQHKKNVVGAKNTRTMEHYINKFLNPDISWMVKSLQFTNFIRNYYYDMITTNEKKIFSEYLTLLQMNRIKTIIFIHKNDFLRESLQRRFLQIISLIRKNSK